MRRITFAFLASAAAAGCTDSNTTAPAVGQSIGPTCTSIQVNTGSNETSNCVTVSGTGSGGGGGGGGSGTGAPSGLYRLTDVDGLALPFIIADDSVVTTDSTRIQHIQLDSSVISLNQDSSVIEIDYFDIHDVRLSIVVPSFNFTKFSQADSSFGAFSDSSGQPVVTLNTGIKGFSFAGDSIYGLLAYVFVDSVGTDIPGTATFSYRREGSSFSDVVTTLKGAMSAASIRRPSVGGAGLRFISSFDRGRRFRRVVGQ